MLDWILFKSSGFIHYTKGSFEMHFKQIKDREELFLLHTNVLQVDFRVHFKRLYSDDHLHGWAVSD